MIIDDVERKIERFNEIGLHYNLVADQIYVKRFAQGTDPFSVAYLSYVMAGLIVFDMERMMGASFEKFDFNGKGFAYRLSTKVKQISQELRPLMNVNLTDEINLQQHGSAIINAYNVFSPKGNGGFNEKKDFHVGATKVLHFLNPHLFIIVDKYAARAFSTINYLLRILPSQDILLSCICNV